jgi:hypothetical protein
MKVKEAEALDPRNLTESLGVELRTFMHAQSTKEKVELLEKHISSDEKGIKVTVMNIANITV